ncbi:MAG: methyltransferase, TrmH family, group 1 [Alphaproteobacteria bacterium]|nr:methyltransferase, TrmH family, group 1 [Alphaproteobacteria bacterium]
MGEHIGLCARAMLNCGLTDLRLVAPRDGWPSEVARATSSGAVAVIDGARLYPSLAKAVADRKFVVATTARGRDMAKPILVPETAASAMIKIDGQSGADSVSALVFGPERTGLTNEDLTFCDALLTIPLNPDYASLNIAQAVLLVCYEWHKQTALGKSLTEINPSLYDQLAISDLDLADKGEMENLLLHLEDALQESGFFTAQDLKPTILRNLRNMFQRMRLSRQEARSFHGMIKALHGREWKRRS